MLDLIIKEVSNEKITCNEKNEIIYSDESDIGRIKKFMSELPCIIHVTGEDPFHVVHAVMPFSDEKLKQKIEKNELSLNENEKFYAIHARENLNIVDENCLYIRNVGRNESSIVAYSGHSIIKENSYRFYRSDENTYNVDSGAYFYKVFIVISHNDKNVFKVGSNSNGYVNGIIQEKKGTFNNNKKSTKDLSFFSSVENKATPSVEEKIKTKGRFEVRFGSL